MGRIFRTSLLKSGLLEAEFYTPQVLLAGCFYWAKGLRHLGVRL